MKTLFQIFLFFYLLSVFLSIKENSKQAMLYLFPTDDPGFIKMIQAEEICVDTLNVKMDPSCTWYEKNCQFCYTANYYEKCKKPCKQDGQCDCKSYDFDWCSKVEEKCNTCFKKWKVCQCPNGLTLRITNDGLRKCVLQACESNQYRPKPLCTTCNNCKEECLTCLGPDKCEKCKPNYCRYNDLCYLPGDHGKFSCPKGTFKYVNPENRNCAECVDQCKETFYGNIQTQNCDKCVTPCLACKNANICTSCIKGYCLIDGKCLKECPNGSFKRYNTNGCFECVTCEKCPNTSWCDSDNNLCSTNCVQPFFIHNKKCTEECPQGLFYDDKDTKCKKCDQCPSSTFCNEANKKCDICKAPNFLIPSTRRCDSVCKTNEGIKICIGNVCKCILKCPSGYFYDKENNECGKCNENCLECVGNRDTCKYPCPKGKVFNDYTCVDQCPEGHFAYDPTDASYAQCLQSKEDCICGKCQDDCNQCVGPKNGQCIKCKDGKYQSDGNCVDECGEGKYLDDKEKSCNCCDPICKYCFGSQINQCTECKDGAVKKGTTCYAGWKNDYYAGKFQKKLNTAI